MEGDAINSLATLEPLQAAGQIVIHRGYGPAHAPAIAEPQPVGAGGGLDDLF